MQNIMQCRQCSSLDLKKITDTEYRCNYCGATYFRDAVPQGGGKPVSASVKPDRRRVLIVSMIGMAVAIMAGAAAFLMMKGGPRPVPVGTSTATDRRVKPDSLSEFGREAIREEPKPRGTFTRVAEIPDSIGNVYFMGVYRNTGESVMQKPMITVILYSAEGRKAASGRGYAIRESLPPGEETPVIILVSNPPKYARFEVRNDPEPPYAFAKQERLKMAFRNVIMQRGRYSGYEIAGEIANNGRKAGRWVNIIALLLDRDNRIIGGGTGYLAENTLKAGDYGPFRIDITTVRGEPRSFILDYSCGTIE